MLVWCLGLPLFVSFTLAIPLWVDAGSTGKSTSCPSCSNYIAPVCHHVQFKIAVLVYKALHDLLPAYLAEDCQLVCHWTPTTAFVGHRHVPSAVNQHTFWRSLLLNFEYGTVCQPSCESQTLHSDSFVEHQKASIWSVTAAAPSDSVFHALCVNWLTSLLTWKLESKWTHHATHWPCIQGLVV